MAIPVKTGDFEGFAVAPRTDCPHLEESIHSLAGLAKLFQADPQLTRKNKCSTCQDASENWVCVNCRVILCSRYVNQHMVDHGEGEGHRVALSFSDGSLWCFACNDYVTSKESEAVGRVFSECKFGEDDLATKLGKVSIGEDKKDSMIKELAQEIKSKKYNKILFVTGAGISVSAGIPDFRTPGTGLYSQLKDYKLPTPQAIFSLDYFKQNPMPFYKLSKEFLSAKVKPVISHKLINKVNQEGLLLRCFTQNIDGLELQAGLPHEKLVQAHGHYRSCHCIACRKEYPVAEFQKAVDQQKPLKCSCGALVKPDITFFGESLPASFSSAVGEVKSADLVFVMGTSLAVFPFAFIVEMIDPSAKLVLINRQNSIKKARANFIFLEGDIDKSVEGLVKQLNWQL